MIPIVSRLTRLILFLGGFALLASLGSLISGADDGDRDDGALDADAVVGGNTDVRLSGDAEYDAFTALGRRRAASLSAFLASSLPVAEFATNSDSRSADETREVRAALIAQWKRENAVLEGAFQEAQRIHLARGPVERVTALANLVPEDQLPRLLADAMRIEWESRARSRLGDALPAHEELTVAVASDQDPESRDLSESIDALDQEATRVEDARRASAPADALAVAEAHSAVRGKDAAARWLASREGLAEAHRIFLDLHQAAENESDARLAFARWLQDVAANPPDPSAPSPAGLDR